MKKKTLTAVPVLAEPLKAVKADEKQDSLMPGGEARESMTEQRTDTPGVEPAISDSRGGSRKSWTMGGTVVTTDEEFVAYGCGIIG